MSEHHWGWLVAIYLFLGGMGAGSFIIASLVELSGERYKHKKTLLADGCHVLLFFAIRLGHDGVSSFGSWGGDSVFRYLSWGRRCRRFWRFLRSFTCCHSSRRGSSRIGDGSGGALSVGSAGP